MDTVTLHFVLHDGRWGNIPHLPADRTTDLVNAWLSGSTDTFHVGDTDGIFTADYQDIHEVTITR